MSPLFPRLLIPGVIVALTGAVLASTGRAVATVTEQRVEVLAYGCPFTGAKTVTISMQNRKLFGSALRDVRVPASLTSDGALHFEFRVPPAPVEIYYSVDGQKCMSGGGGLVVLPGHDRRIVVSMFPELAVSDWHARKFFAGTLPRFVVSVSVVATMTDACPDDTAPETAASIDGGAYYAGYVYGRHTFLKIRSSLFDTLYIRLPDASPVESNNQYVRRDVTAEDLRTLATHGLNQDAQCVRSPSGASMRFNP